jgi:hypothetical protein
VNKGDAIMDPKLSLFDRLLTRPRPIWVALLVSVTLLLLPFAAAMLDGRLSEFIYQGQWRVYLMAPTITLYIWLISPRMARVGAEVVTSLRPLVDLDDESFASLVNEASQINPLYEIVAFAVGAIFGIASALASGFGGNPFWLSLYAFISSGLMYGLLALAIYVSVAGTRLNTVLHRQQLRVDILDPAPFESVGRQSLLLALVFIGGITLSLLFILQVQNITSWEFWLTYLLLVLVILLIFILNMRPTHQLLAQAKENELAPLQKRINSSCRALLDLLDQDQDAGALSGEINALVAYEDRLGKARTWPYNTTMLRTLFFSVFIPFGSVLARLVLEFLSR